MTNSLGFEVSGRISVSKRLLYSVISWPLVVLTAGVSSSRWGLLLPAPCLTKFILQHNLQVAHRAFLARKLAEAEAQEAQLALSLVVCTPAFDARYTQAVEEWKALCFSDSDLD